MTNQVTLEQLWAYSEIPDDLDVGMSIIWRVRMNLMFASCGEFTRGDRILIPETAKASIRQNSPQNPQPVQCQRFQKVGQFTTTEQ